MDLEKEPREYEEELAEIDTKTILLDIMRTNRLILQALEAPSETETSHTEAYECLRCGKQVEKSERQSHAEKVHNAPRDINLQGLYRSE